MNFVSEDLHQYCINHSSRPHSVCDQLEKYTKDNVERSQMLIGKLEASLLGFLIKTINAKSILEIGTFTGYSALAMAEYLPEDGRIDTIDLDPETTSVAQEYWAKSEHGKKITLHLGKALNVLENLKGSFDFVFIDADKANYINYLNIVKDKLNPNGIIVVDNCLWSGKVLDESDDTNSTVGIKKINDYVEESEEFFHTMLPVRDGMLLIRKL